MDLVSPFLHRLHDSVSRFEIPSAALRDVHALKLQIELRRLALNDIEAICCKLRPFVVRPVAGGRRRLQGRRTRQTKPSSRPGQR